MICSSVNLFFTSNLLSVGLDSKLRRYSNQGGRRLDWVDAVLLRYLIDRLDSSHRLKTYLGFEFRQVFVALLGFIHGLPVSLHSVPLKQMSQIRGPLHTPSNKLSRKG